MKKILLLLILTLLVIVSGCQNSFEVCMNTCKDLTYDKHYDTCDDNIIEEGMIRESFKDHKCAMDKVKDECFDKCA